MTFQISSWGVSEKTGQFSSESVPTQLWWIIPKVQTANPTDYTAWGISLHCQIQPPDKKKQKKTKKNKTNKQKNPSTIILKDPNSSFYSPKPLVPGWLSHLSIWLLVFTQVMISRFMRLSPMPCPSADSTESAQDSLCLSLTLPCSCVLLLFPSLSKINF